MCLTLCYSFLLIRCYDCFQFCISLFYFSQYFWLYNSVFFHYLAPFFEVYLARHHQTIQIIFNWRYIGCRHIQCLRCFLILVWDSDFFPNLNLARKRFISALETLLSLMFVPFFVWFWGLNNMSYCSTNIKKIFHNIDLNWYQPGTYGVEILINNVKKGL